MKAYGGSLTQPMTEVTPSCDTAHNQAASRESYGPFAAAAAVRHAPKSSGTLQFPAGKYQRQTKPLSQDERLLRHRAHFRGHMTNLYGRFTRIYGRMSATGVSTKGQRKLSRRNENET